MSLIPIEEIKKLDPHIDPIDVSRLMFVGMVEGLKEGPWLPKRRPPDPLTLVAGGLFLLVTVPIGGVAEGVARAYQATKKL